MLHGIQPAVYEQL